MTGQAHIISASRRTDIPAFYGSWLRWRVEAGWCEWIHPFTRARARVSLRREDVLAWVFWSKNYAPFLDTLRWLWDAGHRFICHFTITGYPAEIEPRVGSAGHAVETARRMADEFGSACVLWRYDPIVLTTLTPIDWHRERFAGLCAALEGATRRCYFSYATYYRKTQRNMQAAAHEKGFAFDTVENGAIAVEDQARWAVELAAVARGRGITMFTCCNDALINPLANIEKAHCIDWGYLKTSLGLEGPASIAPAHQRPGCGCVYSVDIGRYDTCPFGCAYCYAVNDHARAREALRRHDPTAPSL